MENNQFFIAYLPYLSMNGVDEIDFGFAKLWNFDRKKDDYISNEALKNKIQTILNCYRRYGRNSTQENIGIISIGEIDFREYNDDEKELLDDLKNILFLSFLSKNNLININCNSHGMATSENFVIIFQSFILDSDRVSETFGNIIRFSSGGHRLSETVYDIPVFIPNPTNFLLDRVFFEHLLRLKNFKPLIFRRVMMAAELFFESYYNTPSLSRNVQILLQCSAFEVLFKIPDRDQRKCFRDKIKEVSVKNQDACYAYVIRGRGGRVVARGRYTLKEIWADKFYLLRNSIIHGNKLKEEEFIFKRDQRHSDIALLFFILGIKNQIEKSFKRVEFRCADVLDWGLLSDPMRGSDEIHGFIYRQSMELLRRLARNQF